MGVGTHEGVELVKPASGSNSPEMSVENITEGALNFSLGVQFTPHPD